MDYPISSSSAVLFLCIFLRISVFLRFLPFFPKQSLSLYTKIALAFFLSLIITLPLQEKIQIQVVLDISLAFLALQEVAIGIVMGFLVMMLEQILYCFGSLLSHLMGLDSSEIFAPGNAAPSSLLAVLFFYIGIAFVLLWDGHHFLLAALCMSIEAIPPGSFALSYDLFSFIFDGWVQLYRFLILLAAPFLLLFSVVIMELGILGKMVPQMNIFLMEYPLRLGCALVLLAWFLPNYNHGVQLVFFYIIDLLHGLLQ